MASSTDAHATLVAALETDLVGPFSGAADSTEELPLAPSRWYLTGFLAPRNDRETKDPTAEDDFGATDDDEDEDEPAPEFEPKLNMFPQKRVVWHRLPRPPRSVTLQLDSAEIEEGHLLPDTAGIRICGKLEAADAPALPPGTRALSLFVINGALCAVRRG